MPCGTVLREIMKHDEVVEIILHDQSREGERAIRLDQIRPEAKQTGSGVFWKFFSWIDRGAFEVSTDAFTTALPLSDRTLLVVVAGKPNPRGRSGGGGRREPERASLPPASCWFAVRPGHRLARGEVRRFLAPSMPADR